jgi:hypothetical protein
MPFGIHRVLVERDGELDQELAELARKCGSFRSGWGTRGGRHGPKIVNDKGFDIEPTDA